MTSQPASVSVTVPVSQALDRVKLLLFKPFDLGKWFAIGFCAWLAHLGEQGVTTNFNFGNRYSRGHKDVYQDFNSTRDYVMSNLHWIIPVAVAVAVVVIALWVVFIWLSSRGKFMFLHSVALNSAEIAVPWEKFARQANSLFWFRLVLGLLGSVMTLPLIAFIAVLIVGMIRRGQPSASGIMIAAGLVMVFTAIAIVFALISKFTTDFVVPIMFLREKKCMESWGEFQHLFAVNAGQFLLYILFSIVLTIAITAMVFIIIILTCCIAGCLMAIPYLGTVLLLPILAFKRAYSLHYLAQYGGDYDVFPGLQPPAPNTPVPAI